jgi:cardiolipin synthase
MSISEVMADLGEQVKEMTGGTAAPRPNSPAGDTMSLPNLLTLARIGAIPVIVLLLYVGTPLARWIAFGLFLAASVTDYLDGFLARAWQQQSRLGRMLDPIADKLLVAGVLLMLVADGTIRGVTLFAALVILAREILVSGLREFLAEVRVGVPVSALAKWKTMIQMVALGFLIAGPTSVGMEDELTIMGLALLWIAALVTLYTGFDYFRGGLRHVMEDKP